MPDQAKAASRPRRRFLRFSVRGLIVLVLLVGVWLGWIVRIARIQREAVAAIMGAGGGVKYDWERERRRGKVIPGGRPRAPKWLADLVGVDYFGHVNRVGLGRSLSDTVMREVGRLTQLEHLSLYDSSPTDTGLVHLKGLTKLRELNFVFTNISDAGLAHLSTLTDLSKLTIVSTSVTDAGLVHLKGLNKLSELDLRFTQVTDAGLAHLKGLTNLKVFNLSGTQVTDAGVEKLQRALPNLKIYR